MYCHAQQLAGVAEESVVWGFYIFRDICCSESGCASVSLWEVVIIICIICFLSFLHLLNCFFPQPMSFLDFGLCAVSLGLLGREQWARVGDLLLARDRPTVLPAKSFSCTLSGMCFYWRSSKCLSFENMQCTSDVSHGTWKLPDSFLKFEPMCLLPKPHPHKHMNVSSNKLFSHAARNSYIPASKFHQKRRRFWAYNNNP